jgi:3-hydroxyacyl-CoA dehydrogenase/enoyl-CoA hydratase/3-hydroxybutyryl-CoA epimerase
MQNAFRLLDEAIKAETIDAAMESFGMPMGPIELADTVGLDICLAAGKELAKKGAQGEAEAPKVLLNKVAQGQLGKKTGQGIYRYAGGKAVKDEPGQPSPEMVEALIKPYLDEAQAVLAEGIVADADLIDAGLIFGTGFAPFRGGPLHYLETKGSHG